MSRVRPLRLAGALIGGALLMSALATGVAFLVYGSWETEAVAVWANTRNAALVTVSAFTVFNLTAGLATLLLLARAGQRGRFAHALGGAAAGMVFGVATALLFGGPVEPVVLLVLAVVGALMLLLLRALAGVGSGGAADRP